MTKLQTIMKNAHPSEEERDKVLLLTDDLTNELMDRLIRVHLKDGIESDQDDAAYKFVWEQVSCFVWSMRDDFNWESFGK